MVFLRRTIISNKKKPRLEPRLRAHGPRLFGLSITSCTWLRYETEASLPHLLAQGHKAPKLLNPHEVVPAPTKAVQVPTVWGLAISLMGCIPSGIPRWLACTSRHSPDKPPGPTGSASTML